MEYVGKIVRFTLVLSAVLLVAPWLTSLAYGNFGPAGVRVETAAASMAPQENIYGHSIGSVTSGDLFYIDAADSSQDILASLYITNAPELTPYLRYLILKVTIYYEDENGGWEKTTPTGTNPDADIFLTLRSGPVTLNLPGLARYKIAVESGSYYCIKANKSGNNISPEFYLTIESI